MPKIFTDLQLLAQRVDDYVFQGAFDSEDWQHIEKLIDERLGVNSAVRLSTKQQRQTLARKAKLENAGVEYTMPGSGYVCPQHFRKRIGLMAAGARAGFQMWVTNELPTPAPRCYLCPDIARWYVEPFAVTPVNNRKQPRLH